MLSRPLAPLIALIFPKPLALVRSALNGSATDPSPKVSPGSQQPSSSVWKRLLVMRAMGLVPWSGMNVACGVVGVNPITFLLTTAAGSASWSYVTASVGDILAQLALPDGADEGGQTIASLVQDPALIAKMVVLSLISLVPALFKVSAVILLAGSTLSDRLYPLSLDSPDPIQVRPPLHPRSSNNSKRNTATRTSHRKPKP
jgi:hypothetical protein